MDSETLLNIKTEDPLSITIKQESLNLTDCNFVNNESASCLGIFKKIKTEPEDRPSVPFVEVKTEPEEHSFNPHLESETDHEEYALDPLAEVKTEPKYNCESSEYRRELTSTSSDIDSLMWKKGVSKERTNNVNVGKQFKCSYCGKVFSQEQNLKAHVLGHRGVKIKVKKDRPFRCSECGRTYTRNADLTRHKRIHYGMKPYECPYCGIAFFYKYDLLSHMRIHSEKLFKCNVCMKSFTLPEYLKSHEKMHLRRKPFECTECEETFVYKGDLVIHTMIHIKQKESQITDNE